jgi:hypothetical protein
MDSGSAASSRGPGGCGMARVISGSGTKTVSAVLENVHAAVINKVQVATVIKKRPHLSDGKKNGCGDHFVFMVFHIH